MNVAVNISHPAILLVNSMRRGAPGPPATMPPPQGAEDKRHWECDGRRDHGNGQTPGRIRCLAEVSEHADDSGDD
jgi:hypothetical protein